MANPIIKYVSRTYNTILNDINSIASLVDKPDWFKKIIAGVGDMIGQNINAQVNNVYLRTAFTRKAIVDLLALLDYQLGNRSTSVGQLTFYINRSQSFPLTFTSDDLIAQSKGSITQSSLLYKADAGVTVAAFSETAVVTVISNILTVAKVYVTGDLIRISTTNVLPTPLQLNTDYYVIYVSPTTIKLASSINDALANNPIILADVGTGVHTLHLWSFQSTAHQRKYSSLISIGTADNTPWQKFAVPDLDVLEDTTTVTVASIAWTAVDSLINSIFTDKHYIIRYDSEGNCSIQFGDGTFGAMPSGDVEIVYAVGGGLNSNVSSLNYINTYSGGNSSINGVTNTSVFNGGGDFESTETAKALAPLSLKSRDRFVTVEDGEYLALNFGGIIGVVINKNVYGTFSAQVVIVPSGGGLPSAGLKSTLQTYLISKSILSSADIRVIDPTYVSVAVTAGMKLITGYLWSSVEAYFTLACNLYFSERAKEIQDAYLASGIAAAVAIINSAFTTTFTSSDYVQITKLISKDVFTPRIFGDDIQESNFISYIQDNVIGCQYVIVTLPSFPVSIGSTEIPTNGVMTLSEIV